MSSEQEILHHRRITERGGIALVSFHLARLGYDWAVTEGNCPHGDIWVQIPNRKIGLEVKATAKGYSWFVPRKQAETVDAYCFVHLKTAKCYLLSSAEVKRILRGKEDGHKGVAMIGEKDLPRECLNAWGLLATLGQTEIRLPEPIKMPLLPVEPEDLDQEQKFRTVKKRLADGTIKEYSYPRRRYTSKPKNRSANVLQ